MGREEETVCGGQRRGERGREMRGIAMDAASEGREGHQLLDEERKQNEEDGWNACCRMLKRKKLVMNEDSRGLKWNNGWDG